MPTTAADPLARRGFSRSVLDGPQGIAVSRNGRLTISPARTNVALLYVSLDDVGTAIARVRSGS
jgi:hypothetical protein